MTEEENQSVETEKVEAAAPATESENVQERQETAEERKKRNDQEYNWAEARRKMQEQDRVIRELSENINRMKQPAPQIADDGLDKLADDDIVTAGHAKKLAAKLAKQAAQEAIREREIATLDERMRLKFPDFDQVVAQENIETLKKQRPELFASVLHNPDPSAQAIALYDALKLSGIGEPKTSLEKEKAIKNSQKPLSVNAVSKQSAIGNAHIFENGLTPDLKKSLWKEMQQAMKHA